MDFLLDLSVFFSICLISVLIFYYHYLTVFKLRNYCISKSWEDKNSFLYKILLGKIKFYIVYTVLSFVLALTLVINILTIQTFEAFLIVFSIIFVLLSTGHNLRSIEEKIEKEYLHLLKAKISFNFSIVVLTVLWTVMEINFYEIPNINIDPLTYVSFIKSKIDNENLLFKAFLVYPSEFLDYIIWYFIDKVSYKSQILTSFLVIFIVIKKAGFLWSLVSSILGGYYLWKNIKRK